VYARRIDALGSETSDPNASDGRAHEKNLRVLI